MGNWGEISPIIGGVDVSNILDPPWIKMENRLVFGFIGNWFDYPHPLKEGGRSLNVTYVFGGLPPVKM